MARFKTPVDICLNADKSAVVPCDSPEAAWQLAGAGGYVSAEDAKKYGLKAPDEAADDEAPDEPDMKAVKQADVEDKAVHKDAKRAK